METDEVIKTRIESILPMLNERQRRIYLFVETKNLSSG